MLMRREEISRKFNRSSPLIFAHSNRTRAGRAGPIRPSAHGLDGPRFRRISADWRFRTFGEKEVYVRLALGRAAVRCSWQQVGPRTCKIKSLFPRAHFSVLQMSGLHVEGRRSSASRSESRRAARRRAAALRDAKNRGRPLSAENLDVEC